MKPIELATSQRRHRRDRRRPAGAAPAREGSVDRHPGDAQQRGEAAGREQRRIELQAPTKDAAVVGQRAQHAAEVGVIAAAAARAAAVEAALVAHDRARDARDAGRRTARASFAADSVPKNGSPPPTSVRSPRRTRPARRPRRSRRRSCRASAGPEAQQRRRGREELLDGGRDAGAVGAQGEQLAPASRSTHVGARGRGRGAHLARQRGAQVGGVVGARGGRGGQQRAASASSAVRDPRICRYTTARVGRRCAATAP